MLSFYLLALLCLLIGTGAVWMALIEPVPVSWLYWHGKWRKPLVWLILLGTLAWGLLQPQFPLWLIGPLAIMAIGTALAHRMHQSVVFPAIDDPPDADAADLPLSDDMEIAIIDFGGVSRAYALDHLIHHHIINSWFGDKRVAVTYCAMCRSIIPFDVTDIGPLLVGSYKNANMIVADRKTGTFFQQATSRSIMGKLHPMDLAMVPYQIMTWGELKQCETVPKFARFTEHDLRPFALPIPGLWQRIVDGGLTPGLSVVRHDTSLPARTLVTGVREKGMPPVAVIPDEVRAKGMVVLPDIGVAFVSSGGGINAFSMKTPLGTADLELTEDGHIRDRASNSVWTMRGGAISGPNFDDLRPIAVSTEYWFSWKHFHPDAFLHQA